MIEREEFSSPEATPRRMRPLSEINESCNFSSIESNIFAEASKEVVWIEAMEKEMKMINNDNTCKLVNRSIEKNIISVK